MPSWRPNFEGELSGWLEHDIEGRFFTFLRPVPRLVVPKRPVLDRLPYGLRIFIAECTLGEIPKTFKLFKRSMYAKVLRTFLEPFHLISELVHLFTRLSTAAKADI